MDKTGGIARICHYKPGLTLFIGYTLRTSGSGALSLPGNFMSRDSNQLKKAVERISKFEFSVLLPGHGKPITENVSQKLKEFVSSGFR